MEGYCVKCRAKRDMPISRLVQKQTKTGQPFVQAPCPTCGTTVTKLRTSIPV